MVYKVSIVEWPCYRELAKCPTLLKQSVLWEVATITVLELLATKAPVAE